MRFMHRLAFPVVLALAAVSVQAVTKTQAHLILSADAARPGETVMAGVLLKTPPDWHTYWKNAGDSGAATKIDWQLPEGIKAGEIQWPVPEKLTVEGLTTYVYNGEVMLIVPLTLVGDAPAGTKELKARVSWLECERVCLPGKAEVKATLEVGAKSNPSAEIFLFDAWKTKLPRTDAGVAASAWWEKEAEGDTRPLIMEVAAKDAEDFFPYSGKGFEVQAATAKLPASDDKVRFRKLVKKLEGDWPPMLRGIVLAGTAAEQKSASEINVQITAASAPAAAGAAQGNDIPSAESKPLALMLLFAFIGGLILNVMPCVLPVIALKVLGFLKQSKESPATVRRHGLLYGMGVLVSFLILAGVVIAVQAAGHKASWGMQFGNPIFLVSMTTLVTLVALNLFGVFEVTLSGKLMGAAGELAGKEGTAGAFFNGVLATALATPCTAPFLSLALGFAFTQSSAPKIILIFLTIGLGLAAPYVLLSFVPGLGKFLPKPGAWMERFKVAMGFPMLATAVWLFSLTTTFFGERSWWLGIFLVFAGAAAWVFGAFVQRGARRRGLAIASALVLLATGYAWALEGKLRWRVPTLAESVGGVQHAPEGYSWQRWSAEAVTNARAEGRVVIVDFTANWCLTCNISVKPALESKAVIEKLKQVNAVALVADYTTYPDYITEELARFDRGGVPLVLVYPQDATKPPMILPDPLPYPAPYGPVVRAALDKAAQ